VEPAFADQLDLTCALQTDLARLHRDPVGVVEAQHKVIRNTDKGEN